MHFFKVSPHSPWFLWFVVAQWTVIPLVGLGTEVFAAWISALVDIQGLVSTQN